MRTISTLAGAAVAACLAAHADAAITMPDCDALLAYSATLKDAPPWRIGPHNRVLVLPGVFEQPGFAATFGTRALSLSDADLKTAHQALSACWHRYRAQRNRAATAAIATLDRALRHVGAVRHAIAGSEQQFDADFARLLALPASRDQLAALAVLDRAHGKDGSVAAARHFLDHDIDTTRQIHGDAYRLVSGLLRTLQYGPDHLIDRAYPALAETRTALAGALLAKAAAQIAALPPTAAGLASLDTLGRQDRRAYTLILPRPMAADLDTTIAARRTAIRGAITDRLTAAIDAAPASPQGYGQLAAIAAGPDFAALDATRQAAIKARIATRRGAILDHAVTQATAKLASFPATPTGLSGLAAYHRQVQAGIAPAAGRARMARFETVFRTRAAVIGAAALSGFTATLGALPANQKGLADLAAIARDDGPVFVALPPDLQQRYAAALSARHDAIRQAIAAEDAKLAALPLQGAVYADKQSEIAVRFRSATNATVAIGNGNASPTMLDVTWEQDGASVILRGLPQGNLVFLREGDALLGNGLHLERMGDR